MLARAVKSAEAIMTQTLENYHILDPEQISGMGLPASERAEGYPLAIEAVISLFSVPSNLCTLAVALAKYEVFGMKDSIHSD